MTFGTACEYLGSSPGFASEVAMVLGEKERKRIKEKDKENKEMKK